MICKNCSAEFEGKFCPECGAPGEQEIEQVTEQVAQAVSEPVSESYYYEPAMGDGYAQEQPKKKKKVGLIIAIVIIVLAVAAFCVTAFTDLFFPKQAQFVSILNNMGSEIDADFESIDSEYIETKYTVKLNEENDMVTELIPADVVELVNSIGFTMKNGEENGILTFLENDKKLADLSFLTKDDELFAKVGFSDVVIKLPMYEPDYADAFERVEKVIVKETTALLESKEPVKGEYNGSFDIGAEIKALTITLGESEVNELLDKIMTETADAFEFSDIYEKPLNGFGIKEVSVSALYDGVFSFARNALGMYVVVDDGVEKVEFIYYSNKENRAIYGVSAEDGKIIATDNFEINGNAQSGIVNIETDIDGLEMLSNMSLTYTAKNNSVETQATIVDGTEEIVSKCSMVNENGAIKFFLNIGLNKQELGSLTAEMSACEKFEVEIDTSKAVDFSDYNFDAQEEALNELIDGLQTLVEENEDSTILGLLGDLFATQEMTILEQYMFDEFGIEYTQTDFSTANRASYVAAFDDMIDIQTFGYENDIVKEMSETLYMDVYGYTQAQQQAVLDAMKSNYAHAEALDDALVICELYDDYVIVTVTMYNLDNPQNIKAFMDAGLILGDASNATQLSFSQSATMLATSGYEKVE